VLVLRKENRGVERTMYVPDEGISDLERIDIEVDLDGDESAGSFGVFFELFLRSIKKERSESLEEAEGGIITYVG
jgi:hypothetical protein